MEGNAQKNNVRDLKKSHWNERGVLTRPREDTGSTVSPTSSLLDNKRGGNRFNMIASR